MPWMSPPDIARKSGILVPALILLALAINLRRKPGFQYCVTLHGEFSSGPNVPPAPSMAWHFRQCFTKSS
jgi:hypothetical protein